MTIVVFTGPTLSATEAEALLPCIALPPAGQGDVWRAWQAHRPAAIGLIDGVFLHAPAVWHRELLWAMRHGVHVFGAASMGALRAAELAAFGMRGVGCVFAAYRDGVWLGSPEPFEDDDEVAVTHAPAAMGAAALSDAMVDLRATLRAARDAGLLAPPDCEALAGALKRLPFPERSLAALARLAEARLDAGAAAALLAWLPAGRVACKRQDAIALLHAMAAFMATDPAPFVAPFHFAHTQAWDDFVRAASATTSAEEALVLAELRLRPRDWREAALAGLGRRHALAAAPPMPEGAERHALDSFRRHQGLARRTDIAAWLADNAVPPDGFARLLHDEAALAAALAAAPDGCDRAIADQLRLAGRFAPLLRRARAKQATLAGLAAPSAGPDLDAALAWFADQAPDHAPDHALTPEFRELIWREYVFLRRPPQ